MEPSQQTTLIRPPTLNYDVLLSVLSRSSRKTATSMMATCHFLYHEGAKFVLHHWPVTFDSAATEHTALSLLRFIEAEHFSRCSYIRKLFVSMQPMPSAVAQSLTDLLPRMTSLEAFFLNIDDALESHPDLLSAFASLRSVKDLVVNGSERSCELVHDLQSQLVSAQLCFSPQSAESGQRLFLNLAFHPLLLLQRSASTLKMLTCSFWCDMDPRIFVDLPKVRYPSMHILSLYECRNPQGLTPYMKSFPNLAHITVDENGSCWDPDEERAALAVFQRNMNLAQQGASLTGESLSWKHLHDYTGRVRDLWFLGLYCPIPRLSLEDNPLSRPPRALTDVLSLARPTDLTLAFRTCSLMDALKADFPSALRSEGALCLRRLNIFIELKAGDHDLDIGRPLWDIVKAILHLKLTHIELNVIDTGLDEPDQGEDELEALIFKLGLNSTPHTGCASDPKPLNTGERTLDAFDVDTCLFRLLHSIHTLQDTTVLIQSPRRRGGAMRGGRVKSQGFTRNYSTDDDSWGLPELRATDPGRDGAAGLCRETECAREFDGAWWGEIAALDVVGGKM